MKARDIDLSVVEHQGSLKVWGCTFKLPGSIRQDGKINEKLRRQLEKKIIAALSTVEF